MQKNKSIMVDFVANSLSNGPNFWNILHHIPKKMLPNELKVVDQVFNQQHLLDLAKVSLLLEFCQFKLCMFRSKCSLNTSMIKMPISQQDLDHYSEITLM